MSINTKGKKCACGRIGCLEAYASAKALEEQTVEAMLKHPESKLWELANGDVHNVTGKTPFDGYELNDPTAKKVIKKYLVYLGEGILNYCNIFRPNIIILGGGLSGNKLLLPLLTSYCKKRHYGFLNTPKVEIKTASLGNDAGIIGAASLFD
jgi:glucokinase